MIKRRSTDEKSARQPSPAQDVAALLAASETVNSALGLNEALKGVLASARGLLQAHEGSVMLLGDDGYLRILASEGIPDEISRGAKIRFGEGVAGQVAKTGQPVLITVSPPKRTFESFVDRNRPLTSAVVVPLRAGDRMVGVLSLNLTSGDRSFTGADLKRAEAFGAQAALAILKAQLLDDAQTRAGQLARLLEAGRSLAGTIELEPLLNRVLAGGINLAPAAAGFVCLFDQASGTISLGVYRDLEPARIEQLLADPALIKLLEGESSAVVPAAENPMFAWMAEKGPFVTTIPMRAEGQSRAVLVLAGPRPNENGLALCQTFAGQAGMSIRNAQLYRELGRKELELGGIISSITNPVIVADSAGRLLVANPAAENLFSFSADFMKLRPITGMLGEPRLEGLLTQEELGEAEVEAGAVPRVWKARASHLSVSGAGKGGKILVLEDVTTQRTAERQKADFAAVAGHELRTPLTLIKAYLMTLISRGYKLTPEQISEALTTANAQAHKLERLIEDLLYVSRMQQDEPELDLQEADLVPSINGLIDEFRAEETGRELEFEGPDSMKVVLDRVKVEQVLFHLLQNACKYSERDAPVKVVLSDLGKAFEVSVVDKGIGIISSDLPALFQRFHQVDGTNTRAHGGTGVGLYIAKSLVDAHGGEIGVESLWGKGSTFRFKIPKLAPPPSKAFSDTA